MKMKNKEHQRQLKLVRGRLLQGLKLCNGIPSTVALSALAELTVDTAVSLMGREQGVECICRVVNILMTTKHRKAK